MYSARWIRRLTFNNKLHQAEPDKYEIQQHELG